MTFDFETDFLYLGKLSNNIKIPLLSGLPVPKVYWTINESESLLTFLAKCHCPDLPDFHVVSTTMSVARLESNCIPRAWAGEDLGCVATNTNISRSARTDISLDMMGKYLSIHEYRKWPTIYSRNMANSGPFQILLHFIMVPNLSVDERLSLINLL